LILTLNDYTRANLGIFSLLGFFITPFSVMIPVIDRAGVTSKAGFNTRAFSTVIFSLLFP
jgi:hypothetical protein